MVRVNISGFWVCFFTSRDGTKNNVRFRTLGLERFPAPSAWSIRQGKLHEEGSAMPDRNLLTLDPNHNSALRVEIGEQLRVLLSKDQSGPTLRVQHLLDCLRASDATGGGPKRY